MQGYKMRAVQHKFQQEQPWFFLALWSDEQRIRQKMGESLVVSASIRRSMLQTAQISVLLDLDPQQEMRTQQSHRIDQQKVIEAVGR